MVRMRTVKQTIKYFRELDPDTCLTEYFLRTAIKRKQIPGVTMAGNKFLINIDVLEDFLAKNIVKL